MSQLDAQMEAAIFQASAMLQAIADENHPQDGPCPLCRARDHVDDALFELREAQRELEALTVSAA